ncbi:MAG: biopolymer transporter ExbD [Saprospiraceae bacterium]|nr:biopolymer transporter ExbD [Saprospiraceae bacterium]
MGLKKRAKVSAEFSMSSLTDIIFLLLIFFMLTASTVQINFSIPESNSRTVAPATMAVTLRLDGTYLFNGRIIEKQMIPDKLGEELSKLSEKDFEDATLTIISEKGVTWKQIYEQMEFANQNRIRAIIATQPKKE